ncbi:hypothetical protein [Caulobacter mirabilis]|uniref:Uncharacterized protein n=1 Tax=Caulobacter mirabilis TaxID=69666 RepID=A0A2D2AYP7_9CAUL|nr:hypothetical protein [Caulobacter mirabilis]ATQ43138.1 hypothetical protein CSW64_12290 [Caulobacter mirabilis]
MLAAATFLSTGSAVACVMEAPLPGETAEAAQARWRSEAQASALRTQRDLWTQADRVFVATAAEPEPPEAPRYDPRRDGPPRPPRLVMVDVNGFERTMILTPSTALKGAPPLRAFEVIDSAAMTTCGYRFRFNSGGLSDKEPVVVFSTGAYPTRDRVLDALSFERIVDPEIRAALDRAGAAR